GAVPDEHGDGRAAGAAPGQCPHAGAASARRPVGFCQTRAVPGSAHPGGGVCELDRGWHAPTAASTPRVRAPMLPLRRGVDSRAAREPDKVLATVLFSDIVGSTAKAAELGDARWRELLTEHHARVRAKLARYRGTEVDTAGDGFFARFDGPARGIRCAL